MSDGKLFQSRGVAAANVLPSTAALSTCGVQNCDFWPISRCIWRKQCKTDTQLQ